jgi:hypothetical protein
MLFLGIPGAGLLGVFMKRRKPAERRLVLWPPPFGWMMMTARFFGLKTGGCRCRRSGATGSTRHKAGYGDP